MKPENANRLLKVFPSIFREFEERYNRHAANQFFVGDGWFGLIFYMLVHINKLMTTSQCGLDVVCVQLKEKFGGLRFYYNVKVENEDWFSKIFRKIDSWIGTKMCRWGYFRQYWALTSWRKKHIYRTVYEKLQDIVAKAELESTKTCERCSIPGTRGETPQGWILTLCEKHANKLKEEENE